MNIRKSFIKLFLIFLVFIPGTFAWAQIEARLATQCATSHLELPLIVKNLQDIKAFQLKIHFNNQVLQLDTSLYHYTDFNTSNNELYRISATASNDTITISWAAYYGVSITDGLLLSLVFSEIGSGSADFQWMESQCSFTNFNNLQVDTDYLIDNPLTIPYNSPVIIGFEQFTTGCRDNSENGGCKAQVEVNIDGGVAPYIYKWADRYNQNDSIAIGLCEAPVSVVIRDAGGCIYASQFDPAIYPASVYTIKANPEVIYITKPYVDFTIETEDLYIEKYEWNFGDETKAYTENASHTYGKVGVYPVSLKTENIDGCDTLVTLTNFEVKELNFCIPNVFTPNGDEINDLWIFKIVDGSSEEENNENLKSTGLSDVKKCSGEDLIFEQHFKSSSLTVFNRAGNRVFDCSNCTENWDGGGLPDGVYYYVFTWEGQLSQGTEHGNVTILNGK